MVSPRATAPPGGYRCAIRPVALILAVVAAALAGGALAARIQGTARGEFLVGTPRADVVRAGGGHDRIAVQMDGARDTVFCGRGRDVVTADRNDRLAADCEVVSRAISRDTYRNADSQHETQAEPGGFAYGSTVVTAFQTGRREAGGAADIGWATSLDGGGTWRAGHLPAVTEHSTPAGRAAFASDPVVAYSEAHGVWMIGTLAVSDGLTELYVSRSRDGLSWSRPVVAASAAQERLAYDKNWLVCDNQAESPYYGRCYLPYTDHQARRPAVGVIASTDGGASWSRPVLALRGADAVGVLPVVRPDGSLVMPYLGGNEIAAVRTSDGGATWSAPVRVAGLRFADVPSVRAFPLPAVGVTPDGTVHVAWHDCRFRATCTANDVVVASSADGGSWTEPVRVSRGVNAFTPALAVDPVSGRLAISYHGCRRACGIDLFRAVSDDGGATWGGPLRLTAQSMPLPWIARTSSGRMLADYIYTGFVGGRTVTVYALASKPAGGRLKQAIFATRPLP